MVCTQTLQYAPVMEIQLIMKSASSIIKEFLKRKEISLEKLARMMNDSGQNLGKKLKSDNMGEQTIMEISLALNHNFFEDLYNESKPQFFDVGSVFQEPAEKYGKPSGPIETYIEMLIEKKLSQRTK